MQEVPEWWQLLVGSKLQVWQLQEQAQLWQLYSEPYPISGSSP